MQPFCYDRNSRHSFFRCRGPAHAQSCPKSSWYINEMMKQNWSVLSQNITMCHCSHINYLLQPLASQMIVPSDQISRWFAYFPLTSDKVQQSLVQRSLQTLILLHVLFLWRKLYLCLNCSEPTRVSVTSRFKAKPWFFKIYPNDLFCCLQCRRLIRAS